MDSSAAGTAARPGHRQMHCRKAALLLSFLLALQLCCAEVSVVLLPAEGEGVQELYQHEVGGFVTRVRNHGELMVKEVFLHWEVNSDLIIVQGPEGFESGQQYSSVVRDLLPGEARDINTRVKPLVVKRDDEENKKMLVVWFGEEARDSAAVTYVKVIGSPLKIDASLSKKVIKPGDSSEVKLSLKNLSDKAILVKSARLVLPDFLAVEPGSELGERTLTPEEEISNKNLKFVAAPGVISAGMLVLRVEFVDEQGQHVIERDFSIEVRGIDYGMILLIAIIIVLIIAVLLSKRRQKRMPVKPAE